MDRDPVAAEDQEKCALQELDAMLRQMADDGAVLCGPTGESLPLPVSAFIVLARAVHEMARGRAVTLDSLPIDLSTWRAADLLNVSHEFLVGHLLGKELPFHITDSSKVIKLRDLLAYREHRDRRELEALREMADDAQEMGIYVMDRQMAE